MVSLTHGKQWNKLPWPRFPTIDPLVEGDILTKITKNYLEIAKQCFLGKIEGRQANLWSGMISQIFVWL